MLSACRQNSDWLDVKQFHMTRHPCTWYTVHSIVFMYWLPLYGRKCAWMATMRYGMEKCEQNRTNQNKQAPIKLHSTWMIEKLYTYIYVLSLSVVPASGASALLLEHRKYMYLGCDIVLFFSHDISLIHASVMGKILHQMAKFKSKKNHFFPSNSYGKYCLLLQTSLLFRKVNIYYDFQKYIWFVCRNCKGEILSKECLCLLANA